MASRSVSPVLVGRGPERAELLAAHGEARHAATAVLVGGEAGMGTDPASSTRGGRRRE
ncbi:hypothetical protein [Actinomadura sp. NPDC049753]|uniref:hypothetical protein n=1 Tax=Actinomadura sp. NPDC049753 TaxID=3154739 RepID=UPI003417E870